MKAIITVLDKRTFNQINTRSKEVNSENEAVEWARKTRNRVHNFVTILDKGYVHQITI